MYARIALLALALVMTGCGKNKIPTAGGVEAQISVAAKAVTTSDDAFWANYPAQVAWVTIKSQKTDYMVVRMSAKRLGFNQGAKIFFPVKVAGKTQFNSNLFLGKDKGLYVSELGSGTADYRFYKVGSFGARSLEFTEGDPIKLRLDTGFTLDASVDDGTEADGPSFTADLLLKAMPTVVTHARLFSRTTAGT
ncbi:MAG: hypothetical protein JWM80_6340 [Cyanobacteria bacterium RYN_339]|nr:hypothetical protein [Cyanobacteria bacterium RYN_339]